MGKQWGKIRHGRGGFDDEEIVKRLMDGLKDRLPVLRSIGGKSPSDFSEFSSPIVAVGDIEEISVDESIKVMEKTGFSIEAGDSLNAKSGGFNGKKLDVEKLSELGLAPKYRLSHGGEELYLSRPFETGRGRMTFISYNSDEKGYMARTVYLSRSHGQWRYLAGYTTDDKGDLKWYHKGRGEESVTLPTMRRKALFEILDREQPLRVGDKLPNNGVFSNDDAFLAFAGTAKPSEGPSDLAESYRQNTAYSMQKLKADIYPIRLINEDKTLIESQNLRFSRDNEPDFSQHMASYRGKTDYGVCDFDVFQSPDGMLHTFMMDQRGRGQYNSIEDPKRKVTSHGIYNVVIDGGCLTTPLKGYESETGVYGGKKEGRYYDMYEKYVRRIEYVRQYESWKKGEIPVKTLEKVPDRESVNKVPHQDLKVVFDDEYKPRTIATVDVGDMLEIQKQLIIRSLRVNFINAATMNLRESRDEIGVITENKKITDFTTDSMPEVEDLNTQDCFTQKVAKIDGVPVAVIDGKTPEYLKREYNRIGIRTVDNQMP